MKKITLMNSKKHASYVMKSFVWMKMMKLIKIEETLKITVIILGNLEELLIEFAI